MNPTTTFEANMRTPGYTIQLQPRDITILRGLFESRVMTAVHIADIYFYGRKEAAKKRLQKLRAAGLIAERPRRAYEPAVLSLTKGGLLLLDEHGILAEYPAFSMNALEKRARVSDATIQHELEVMDVKAAFYAALRGHETFSIAEFGTWPRLYEFATTSSKGSDLLVKPDGFLRINEKEPNGGIVEHTFFIEVDRSTEIQDILVSRAFAYLDYYRSGNFAIRNGGTRSEFKNYPFRVLMVVRTKERRNNLVDRLLEHSPPILTFISLATKGEVRENTLRPIWISPIDYREALAKTASEPKQKNGNGGHPRTTTRETQIEKAIKKTTLIAL